MNNLVILLTGTITPNSFTNLTIKDPETRQLQYMDALNFYIQRTKYKIIFAENSGANLENFPIMPERIEYLSFKSHSSEPDRGKAFKEMEIIDFVFQNSKFLNETEALVKITGRLKVLNVNGLSKRFLKLIQKRPNLIYGYPYRLNNMDARCFYFTKDFWPYLKEKGKNINLQYNFELSLWDAAHEYRKLKKNNYISINPPPRIKGISGAFGNIYRHNLLFHYGRIIRSVASRILGNKSLVE